MANLRKHCCKLLEMSAYPSLLMLVFLEKTFLDDELNVFLLYCKVDITLIYVAEHVFCKLEFRRAINQLLDAKDHSEMCAVTHMTKSLKNLKVTVELRRFASAFEV